MSTTQRVEGYPSLGDFIASDKDQLSSIYPRFHRLSARNLLYLEAELAELQAQQDKLDAEDYSGSPERKTYARSWVRLNGSNDPRHKERLELVRDIREKIKEYHEALVLEQTVLNISKPHHRTVAAFRAWFNGTSRPRGHEGPVLDDIGIHRLDNEHDLAILVRPPDHDLLIRFVRRCLKVFFIENEIEGSIVRISERQIARWTAIISTTLAAILLIGAVVSLYFAHSSGLRLGLIGAFTTAFAVIVGALTNARRAELFGSTAAYAAVLVIFVGSPLVK